MSADRREHARYKPREPLNAVLRWQDEMGAQQATGQLNDVSQGGCSLLTLVWMAVVEVGAVPQKTKVYNCNMASRVSGYLDFVATNLLVPLAVCTRG